MFGRATIRLGIDHVDQDAPHEGLRCCSGLVAAVLWWICEVRLIMAALCYRAGHYIFALWFLSFFFFFFFFLIFFFFSLA